MVKKGELKICDKGHRFYKSSDCPTCPICEKERKPDKGFLSLLGSPARRALQQAGVNSVANLAKYSELEILKLHGMGPGSIPKLRKLLADAGLTFKQE
jgi:hypothetical protein